MRIILFAAGAALVGCGGTTSTSGSQEQSGGMPNAGGSIGSGGHPTGGMPGTGGSAGKAGAEPTDCGNGVLFRLSGTPLSEKKYCLGQPGTCGRGAWLEVFDALMQTVWLARSCSMAACSECQLTGCPGGPCLLSTPLSDEGTALQWDGVRWTGGQTCGSENLTCVTPSCASAGVYFARFCAYELMGTGSDPNSFDVCELNASMTPTCYDVQFELPGAEVVEGVLPVP